MVAQPDVVNAQGSGEASRRSRRGARSGDPRKRDTRKRLARDVRGRTEPRIWTKPLRELKPDVLDAAGNIVEPATSLGFERARNELGRRSGFSRMNVPASTSWRPRSDEKFWCSATWAKSVK